MTDRQKEVYEFLSKQTEENGYPPSIREIGKALGISTLKGVTCHLEALERKGYIERSSAARGIKLKHKDKINPMIQLEIKSENKLKSPEFMSLPRTMLPTDQNPTFLYQIKGSSNRKSAILDGDIVVVQAQNTAKKGELIMAEINGRTVIQKFEIPKKNSKRNIQINGKIVGLLRGLAAA